MNTRFTFILLMTCLLAAGNALSQTDTTLSKITIFGQLRDENDQPISNAIIINKRSKTGSFGHADGSFTIQCDRTDTLAITSLGFHARTICFADSTSKDNFSIKLYLETRVYQTVTVEIFAPRDLEKIQNDIKQLGYNEDDYMLSGINAVASPITFLYQAFSKKEQSKREAAYLWNEDKKRDLLKELFKHYVDYQIIELNDAEFDDFITYLNVSDDFLKNSTQYDFLIFVRDRFRDYKIYLRQNKPMLENDYEYDKD